MFTQTQLETKTGPELVNIFNNIDGVRPVRRFRTRIVGMNRILTTYKLITEKSTVVDPKAVQAELVRAERGEEPIGKTPAQALEDLDTQLEEDEADLAKRQPRERGVYNLPRKDLIRTFRPNSRRGRLIAILLGQGATFDELLVKSEFREESVLHKTIRILNWWTGYRISTDDDGIITISS